MANKIEKLIFPSGFKCLICGCEINDDVFEICDKCFSKLPFVNGKVCLKCGEPIFSDANYCVHCKKLQPSFTKCFAPFVFESPISDLIHKLKYDGNKFVAKTLSNLILKCFLEQNLKVDVVIPVPLYLSREAERGFNQAFLLTQSFIDAGFEIDNSSVIRVKNTNTQTALSKIERTLNMENAFKVINKEQLKNKNVLLIDDVYTTGATFNALSEVLLKAGVKNVYGLSVAHTIIEK